MNSTSPVIIAVDGPSASGKSTVSRRAAKTLGFLYVDSGAMYRGITWKCVKEGIDPRDTQAVTNLLIRIKMELLVKDGAVTYLIDGEDPGQEIRGQAVRESVADIAAQQPVRVYIVSKLRDMATFGSLVMEGRDIGSVVFPDTPFKYYLDADPEERARRRAAELQATEGATDQAAVLSSLRKRDQKDSSRATAPLQIALGAHIINSTGMSIDQVVDVIITDLRAAGVIP
ncbi:MAG: (d)CMP kinase [Kiritimatiellae bacterium]|nr:(d)CMP kinase [Kiritimatiellia bacterium]MBP5788391.1 (d)CMP kinase [Kiritimatiellia bacterium]MBQ9343935.1 (d)CMP kinase [Kiritimatiellia bacterium]